METFFMNTGNSKTSESNKFVYHLNDKLNLKNLNKNMTLANLSIYYTWKKIKESYNNKFKISAPTWNKTFDLPDGSYSISDIQNYFEYIIKKHETITNDNSPILIYSNEKNNRIVFKMKSGYKLELLSKEMIGLLGSSSNIIDNDKNSEQVCKLETVEVVLVHCNLVNNNYQQSSKVLFTFVPNKKYGQLINILPHALIMLKTTNAEFSSIEIWFTNQDNRLSDNGNIPLIINTN